MFCHLFYKEYSISICNLYFVAWHGFLYFINIHIIMFMIKKWCFVEIGIKQYSMIIAKAKTSILYRWSLALILDCKILLVVFIGEVYTYSHVKSYVWIVLTIKTCLAFDSPGCRADNSFPHFPDRSVLVPLKPQFCTLNSLFTEKNLSIQCRVHMTAYITFQSAQCMVRSLLSGRSAVLCILYDQLIVQGSVGQRPADPS